MTSTPASIPSTPRKEVVILITSGWGLVVIYLITILSALVPLEIRNPAWSQNLSRLTVDAGSLALVGLCLVRYGTYLRSLELTSKRSGLPLQRRSTAQLQQSGLQQSGLQQSAPTGSASPRAGIAAPSPTLDQPQSDVLESDFLESDFLESDGLESESPPQANPVQDSASESIPADASGRRRRSSSSSHRSSSQRKSSQRNSGKPPKSPRDLLPPDPISQELKGLERNRWLVRRLAIAGAVGMLLLIPLQVVIFLRGVAGIDSQVTQATVQERARFQQLETALQDAPAQQILRGWFQFKQLDPLNPPERVPAPAQQLDDLIGEANRSRDSSLQNLQRQASNARFVLGRDTLRVLLAALVFGWAFWAFFRPA